ncbi:MAG: nucleotidyltransferase domain-containing protein [Bacteroidales bacterium]
MDKEQAINLARKYKELVEKSFPLKEVYLYGSYSKGNYTADSDIDIAVVVDHLEEDYFEDTSLLWKLRRKISSLIEPVLLTEDINNPLYRDIRETGILIK